MTFLAYNPRGHLQLFKHGTRTAYMAGGCRCPLCRKANARYAIAYYHSLPERRKRQIAASIAWKKANPKRYRAAFTAYNARKRAEV